MATPVTTGTTAFAFLNTGGSQSTSGVNARQSASGGGFSDILNGQMRSQPGAAVRPATESARTAHAPGKPTQAPEMPAQTRDSAQAQSAPAAEQGRESSAADSPEQTAPSKSAQSASNTTKSPDDAKHTQNSKKPAQTTAATASSDASATTMAAATSAAASEALGAKAAAELAAATGLASAATPATDATPTTPVSATAAESAAAAAAAASNLAGLPAVIAALLPALAGKQVASTPLASGDGSASAVGAGLGVELGLTGDTGGKSLQNLVAATQMAAHNPELGGQTAQPAAGQSGSKEASVTLADELAIELQTAQAPGAGKSKAESSPGLTTLQTLAAAQLQAKPDVAAGLAERAVLPPPPAEDAPDGVAGSVMHTLRQPGQLPPTTPQLAVATPAGQNGWANEVGNRVMWMVGRAESKAELVLTPPNLGKVEVSINLNGDQTTAQFVAATQSARDALEQAMPRLRELLAQSGISLGQTGVSTSGEQHPPGDERLRGGNGGSGGTGVHAGETGVAAPWVRQTEGLVDTFA